MAGRVVTISWYIRTNLNILLGKEQLIFLNVMNFIITKK